MQTDFSNLKINRYFKFLLPNVKLIYLCKELGWFGIYHIFLKYKNQKSRAVKQKLLLLEIKN